MTTGIDLLRTAFSTSCETVRRVLDEVSEEEFSWEPVGGCWTVHRRSQDRGVSTDGAGEWVLDYDPSPPQPAPFTTIAWRTLHIAGVNYLYWDYAFGSASLIFGLNLPGAPPEAPHCLFASPVARRDALHTPTHADRD